MPDLKDKSKIAGFWQSIKDLFIVKLTPAEMRQIRRDEVGNRCSDMFCLDDPCRRCPNIEDHKKLYHWRYAFIKNYKNHLYGEGKWPE